MGLADRDYMRENYRRARGLGEGTWNDRKARVELRPAGRVTFRPHPAQKWIFLLSFLTITIPAGFEAKRAGWLLPDRAPEVPFPSTGSVAVAPDVDPKSASSRLTLRTGDSRAVVQLHDADTGRHVISMFVDRSTEATIPVPSGRFRVSFVEGQKWHGMKDFFGPSTTFETVASSMLFEPSVGHIITLIRRPDGNLPTRPNLSGPEPL